MPHNHSRGGTLAGIMLTILILAGLAFAALVATGVFIAQNVRVTERAGGGDTTVEIPFAKLRVHDSDRLDPALLGLPVYPGAQREPDGHKLASFHLDLGHTHKAFGLAAAEYRTFDSPERVAEFYRSKLPHWMFKENGDGLQWELTEGGYRKIIAIHRERGETRIGLATIGEPTSN